MRTALVNGRICMDGRIVAGRTVLLDDARIDAVVAAADADCAGRRIVDLAGHLLLPGFIDVQVNGGGGRLFNDDPSVESIRRIGAAHRRYGTTGFLPTLISDDLETIGRAIAAVQAALEAGVPGVLGIHIEGPFLNFARRGVHDARHLRPLDASLLSSLCQLRGGRTVLTLAPEMTSPQMISRLAQAGVLVSGGHSNASYAETMAAIAHGLRGFTHLFNAMAPLAPRAPGIIGAALHDPNTWCGIIVDGHHVDPVMLQLALRCKRHDRFMLVTDAMPVVGSDAASFVLQGRTIHVQDGVCRDEEGTLAGTALDMAGAVRNAVATLGLELGEAARMASEYPAEFLGLGSELGRIAPGYRANLVLVDAELRVRQTWIDGRSSDPAG
jgi:N-acetylglucosamine-6-phosphate deacetylase